jgi:hypothetical protein
MPGMPSPNRLRTLLSAFVLVALVATGLGAGYYFASASTSSFAVTWSVRPLDIKFSLHSFSGSAPDSFTCSQSVSPVFLKAFSNQAGIVTLAASPSSFSSCGSTPNSVLVTAACTSKAQADNTCQGDFSGRVIVCGPTPYTCLQRDLIVIIKLTTGNDNGQTAQD